ncbi:MAG TPA: maleylacetoacetate isomerase [Anaeromyxobacter sp.]|nr:maleylacetoacetate isomerase [Anaeromyxobacter sp.]
MTLRLYSWWRSSSSWRVRIGLALKSADYEYRSVNLLLGEQHRPEHRARSPFGHLPVLEIEEGGRTLLLVQSMAILEYLDERLPDPPLLPRDAEGRARVRALAEHVNASIQPFQNSIVQRFLREREPGLEREFARHFVEFGLRALEAALGDGQTGRFCHGDAPGLADCYLVPQLHQARRLEVDLVPFPTLVRIEEACAALPAFRAAHATRQPDTPAEARAQ